MRNINSYIRQKLPEIRIYLCQFIGAIPIDCVFCFCWKQDSAALWIFQIQFDNAYAK